MGLAGTQLMLDDLQESQGQEVGDRTDDLGPKSSYSIETGNQPGIINQC